MLPNNNVADKVVATNFFLMVTISYTPNLKELFTIRNHYSRSYFQVIGKMFQNGENSKFVSYFRNTLNKDFHVPAIFPVSSSVDRVEFWRSMAALFW